MVKSDYSSSIPLLFHESGCSVLTGDEYVLHIRHRYDRAVDELSIELAGDYVAKPDLALYGGYLAVTSKRLVCYDSQAEEGVFVFNPAAEVSILDDQTRATAERLAQVMLPRELTDDQVARIGALAFGFLDDEKQRFDAIVDAMEAAEGAGEL